MSPAFRRWLPELIALAVLAVFPLIPLPDELATLGSQLGYIFVFSILALGLNVVVGQTGLLHLGIAAFFGIGAYTVGILTAAPTYPFQFNFFVALTIATLGSALVGVILGAPVLRLRGDYLALVTLGFGEVVRFGLRNLEEITNGTRGLGPIPPPTVTKWVGLDVDWAADFRPFFYLNLAVLALVVVMLRNLERSKLGRAWTAIREDELAATCMGISATRAKLAAFAVGAGIAGLAGGLYATNLTNTAQPDAYDFNRSIIMLCCIILGGLGSIRGTLVGVLILIGFDNILAPWLDRLAQQYDINPRGHALLTFSNWRYMIFGIALILMMRFRPEGLLPSARMQHELHETKPAAATAK
jgi:branched-chain amino acid transport system permease protein